MKWPLLLLLPLLQPTIYAQPVIQWQKTFGGNSFDEVQSLYTTSDSGYIIAGGAVSNNGDVFGHHGNNDYWLIKMRSNGSIQWKKILGGTGNDIPVSIQQTIDGGYIVAGYSSSNDYDVSDNHGGPNDGWVVKLNAAGELQWQKTLGGSGFDAIWDIEQTIDNGYILTGTTNSFDGDIIINHGKWDVWVVKLSNSGNIQWQRTYGGSDDDWGNAIKVTSDGGYIVASETSSNDGDVSGLHGNVDFWITKISPQGDLEWQKTLGGENGDIPSDIIPSNDGGFIVCGYVGSHNSGDIHGHEELGLFDFWIVKMDSSGEIVWQNALGGVELDYARALVADPISGYIVFGSTQSSNGDAVGNDGGSDFWILKLTEDGDLLWQKSFGGTKAEEGFTIDNTFDNGFIVGGYTWSTDGDVTGSPNKGKNDYWIVKLSPENFSAVQTPENPFIQLYPNPARSFINIHAPDAGYTLGVTVNDIAGRTVLQKEIANNSSLDISALPPGIYEAVVDVGDGLRYFAKFEKCME